MSVMWIIVLHPYSEFEVRRLSFSRYGTVSVSALIRLETPTFDLSTSKWNIPCHELPSCQLSARYALPFSTCGQTWDRQTDRQTDRRRS